MILSVSYTLYIAQQVQQYIASIGIRYYQKYRCVEYKRYRCRYYETIDFNIKEASVVINMNLVCAYDSSFMNCRLPYITISSNKMINIGNAEYNITCVIVHHSIVHCMHTYDCIRVQPMSLSEKQLSYLNNMQYLSI